MTIPGVIENLERLTLDTTRSPTILRSTPNFPDELKPKMKIPALDRC
jgi:hypothetical protein